LLVLLGLVSSPAALAVPEESKADHSQEAFVIEQFYRKQKFENDGTGSREDTQRVRIQSEAGVQRYGLLSFSYASGTGTFEIVYVRVRKPDGSVVETPPENFQDMAADITRSAPFYSDLHEKHVTVKGLGVGDVLEFQIREHTTKPLTPGQFWTTYDFTDDEILLDEQLEISVPRDRAIKIKSTTTPPVITEAGGYRIYSWHHKNLEHKDQTNQKKDAIERAWQAARGRLQQTDVQLSSFLSWEDVGRWYGGLQEDRVKPTPEIAAKAAELTKNAADDDVKIRTLYKYVSTQFHYIGIAFGIGRYQPHGAAEVLANQYGDCKDKHTLLASLLNAVGIKAYPALISTAREADEDVPSPGQFDHVLTVVPRDGKLLWLDTTTEVGPYQYLVSPLRDKHALVIGKDQPPGLLKTPADLPFASAQSFVMEAKLDATGTLHGHADISVRGDTEYVLRGAFREVPLPQWKELGQRISSGSGFGGEVSAVTASQPERTDEPFHISYDYTRKQYGDWANHRTVAPSPVMALLAPVDEELLPAGPSWLGPLVDMDFKSRMELPSGYKPSVPAAIHLKEDFAQYDSSYQFKDGKLTSERHLKTFLPEVPASERAEFKQFMKTVLDDYGSFIPLSSVTASSNAANQQNENFNTISRIRNLPDSSNEEATRLEGEAREALDKHDLQTAVSSLYRAVGADPKFARGWILLGSFLLAQKQKDAGIDAFHKAIQADPSEPAIQKVLGLTLMATSYWEDAVPVWQELAKAHPDDPDGPMNLGSCWLSLKRYPEAVAAYETAGEMKDPPASLQTKLASAYMQAGDHEKASAAFAKVTTDGMEGADLNDLALSMADADLQLPLALDYAKKAAHLAEEESQKITLKDLRVEDVHQVFTLSNYWDTVGWVYARMSDLDAAEKYLRASWRLTQDAVTAGHLCQMYKQTHQTARALVMCRVASERMSQSHKLRLDQFQAESEKAQQNLKHLPGGTTSPRNQIMASDPVMAARSFKLARFLSGTESAEFFVLLSSDGNSKIFTVEDTKFISGSPKMKLQGKQLKTINFGFPAPSDSPSHFVVRGILGCYEYSGCSFVVLDPASVNSLN